MTSAHSRIASCMDVEKLNGKHIAMIGTGASANLACDLARDGVQHFTLVDPDRVELANISRQSHMPGDVGLPKAKAVARMIECINPNAHVLYLAQDCTPMSDDQLDTIFGDVDLMIFATDRFAAQAWGNRLALRLGIPAIFAGLYRGGGAGEIAFWHPDIKACYRCLCPSRYAAQEKAAALGVSLDPPSDGATIHDIAYLDSVVGMLAVGLLTRGSDNRFGRLIDQLGDRNFIQMKLDPDWTWNGRDVIREQLGIADDCDRLFAWNTIARRDKDGGNLPCPDCQRFRNVSFEETSDGWRRVAGKESDTRESESTSVPTEPVGAAPTNVGSAEAGESELTS